MRYALYFTPPASHGLTISAARWLGRNAFTGVALDQPVAEGFDAAELAELTADPRRYGFHATLKAPFELAQGYSEADLLAEIGRFAAQAERFDIPSVVIGRLGSFFAFVPEAECAELQSFAADVVRHFEPLRAPLSDADIVRRNPEALAAAERKNLLEWGYPYVFDAFRFHMTLTGKVPESRAASVEAALHRHFAEHHGRPLAVCGLALFREPARGADFTVHSLFPLGNAASRKSA